MDDAADILAMLQTSDDVFSDGVTQSPCFLTTFDDVVLTDNMGGSQQTVRRTMALLRADDYPNLQEDDVATVNGASYTVLETRLIQDGHMMQVVLQKAKGQ